MSPTTTAGLPPVTAWASGALIWRMSHWSPVSGSPSVAGALGRSPSPPAACSSLRWVANASVADTPSTRLSRWRSVANAVLAERATTTPIRL
jgi:hypothetical protein